MDKIFDFGNRADIEKTMRDTWENFRMALANKEFTYSQVDKALETVFLKQFDDFFERNGMKKHFTTSIKDLRESGVRLVRGTILKEGEKIAYDRFIPKSEFIKEDNRFSPPGIEWLYLAIGKNDSDEVETCTIKECKAKTGNRFGICSFTLNNSFDDRKVVDLTIANEKSFDELNEALERFGQAYKRDAIKRFLTQGISIESNMNMFIEVFSKWFSYTYARLLSDQIFVPVNVMDKKLMYAPFQCMAKYFISIGFDGIIFSSTVCPQARNIVLFDKMAAIPFGDIKDFVIG